MTIREELHAELRAAMKERDRDRIDAIRNVESEIALARSAPGFSGAVDDDLYRAVLATYVKKMEKARREYGDLGERGAAQARKLGFEVDYLSRWLPASLGEEETRALVREAIADLGADDPKMAGQVVGRVMKSGRDGLDGALVNRIAREDLGAG